MGPAAKLLWKGLKMMGFGMGGLWMLLVIVFTVLAITALVKYIAK